ncbi:MAG: Sua5/YciO/YrdC/YwlC family protein, partial [Archangium sp.]|nr:Sua5/YciO/YrdC/YwlC family protein [Archangium sp.]
MASAPIVEVDAHRPQPRTIDRAAEVLEGGGLIAYPTDTYYGIGCDLFSKKAIDRLYGIKNRDRKKPLAFLCPDLSEVAQYAKVSNFAYRIMKQLTPGPVTFVLEATRLVPDMMQ